LADATSKGNLKQTNETKDHHDYAWATNGFSTLT
jgi:hypothetical protein